MVRLGFRSLVCILGIVSNTPLECQRDGHRSLVCWWWHPPTPLSIPDPLSYTKKKNREPSVGESEGRIVTRVVGFFLFLVFLNPTVKPS